MSYYKPLRTAFLGLAILVTAAGKSLAQLSSLPDLPATTPRLQPERELITSAFNQNAFFKTFRHATAQVNSVKIHYVIGGQGEPLVLLHGWPTTWYEWRRMMPDLAGYYTVIAPDLRGLGDSDKPTESGAKHLAADDVYKLCRSLGLCFGEHGSFSANRTNPGICQFTASLSKETLHQYNHAWTLERKSCYCHRWRYGRLEQHEARPLL